MNFSDLKLSPATLKAVAEKGYDQPSPIQAQAIPAILNGSDVMAAAQTGTGKTAGFTLPILERLSKGSPAKPNQVRTLILTPTRELAAQVGQSVEDYGKYLNLKSAVVFGGVKINPQMMKLRKGVDILVATPGRLLDLFQQNAVRFDSLEILVLDEADRMLDMGFINDIKKILALLPKRRQNLLFSATFSDEIRQLAKGLVHNPIEISVSPRNSTVESVSHSLIAVDKSRKTDLLIHLLNEHRWNQVLVFSRTKHGANKLALQLEKAKIPSSVIHGNKSQGARTKALAQFKENKIQVLVATDIAARGIDISQLPYVVNVDLPNVPEDYVHRIGRTGRAGATGQAISLVSADEFKQLRDIENVIKQLIPRQYVDGFEPQHDIPQSNLNARAARARSPHPSTHKTNSNKPKRNNTQRNSRPSSSSQSTGNTQTYSKNKSSDSKPSYNTGKPARNTKPKDATQGGSTRTFSDKPTTGRSNTGKPSNHSSAGRKPSSNKPNQRSPRPPR